MAEVGVSIAAKLAEYLIEPTIQQGRYLFCGAKIKRNFEFEKEKLLLTQEGVQKRVEEARRRTDTIDNAVNMWLDDVDSLIQEVDVLEGEIKEHKSCFGVWSPNRPSYCLSKQMAQQIERMGHLNTNHNFDPFSHPTPILDIEYFSSENFMYFESTKLASSQLLEALKNANVYMIGLYGMGGLGKTTLAKEVGKKAKELKLLDHVVLTTVSQTPNIRKIQGEIADLLGMTFTEETEVGRAGRIALRLKSGERILVILDDVWAKLNLEDIGIPPNGNQNRCKVLLTTRREGVCILMGCEKRIPLHLLSEHEAWGLFNKHACINDVTSQDVAREVAKECKGLPIALVAMGSCIKEKDLDDIKVVLHKLRHSKPIDDIDEGEKGVFGCLRLSYDYLKNKESKLLFLMCAMFPEDHRINPEELLRYGIGGLNVCAQVDSLEMARSCVNAAINILIESSLLMRENDIDGDAFYRMHDMVRDVALWIASKEDRTIVVNHATSQNSSLEDGAIKDCYALSWWNTDVDLPQQLDAPKLEILLLNSDSIKRYDFSYASFEGFKGIKVMAMQRMYWSGMTESLILPHSTHLLTNLRTMRLVGMELKDISFVVSLRNLEILDFQKSKLKELPNGLEKLNKLKLLDLSNCLIDGHCYEVIKRCLQLEELYMYRKNHWSEANDGFMDSDTFCLEDASLSKLQRYRLEVGEIRSVISNVSFCKRSLYIGGLNVSTSGAKIKDLLRRAIKVGLKMLKGGCKNVFPELVQAVGGMNELIGLYLDSCSEIECVFNTNSLMASSIDASTVVQSLLLIQDLQIRNCSELKYIMTSGVCDNNRGKQVVAVPDNFYLYFSRMKKLYIENCHKLEYIFPISVVQRLEQLEEIRISNAPDVKYLFSERDHEYHSSHQNEIQIILPHLRVIRFEHLLNLVKIFPESYQYQLSWSSLILFICDDCPKLTIGWTERTCNKVSLEQRQSFLNKGSETNGRKSSNEVSALSFADFEGRAMDLCFFPEIVNPTASRLTKLELRNLPELRHIWMGYAQLLSLQCIEESKVYNCGKLKSLLSPVVQRSLPQLTSISISGCEELEEIIAESEDIDNNLSISDQGCFPNLKYLRVERCHKLKSLFSAAMARRTPLLQSLIIRSCEEIEEIFGCEKMKDSSTNKKKKIVLPNLEDLTLVQLPYLVDICQGFTFHAVKLIQVRIEECPKFAPFLRANQEISIDKSEKGDAVVMDDEVAHEIQIQAILNVKEEQGALMMVSNLSDLILKKMDEVEYIWKGPTLISFQHLTELKVEGCRKMRCIFSGAVIRSLPLLRRLFIKECEELEEIISLSSSEEEEEANFPNPSSTTRHPQHPCFPGLVCLEVEGCNRLRCVFPLSISLYDLPFLQYLRISRCSQVEQVFGCAPQNHDAHLIIPTLDFLTLEELPSLTNIGRGLESRLKLENLYWCEVKDCPKFSSTTIPALHNFIRPTQIHKTDDNKDEDKESNTDDNVGDTSHNIEDINHEDEDVNDDKKNNNEVEDGAKDEDAYQEIE